jgi:DNA-binding transcriptional LysR family regulator
VPKPVSVVYPHRDHLPGKVRVFIDWISELAARRLPG